MCDLSQPITFKTSSQEQIQVFAAGKSLETGFLPQVQDVALLNQAMKRFLKALWLCPQFGEVIAPFSNAVSRMLTVITTLRSQNRPVLDYLVEVCRAVRKGLPAPSLLPDATATP